MLNYYLEKNILQLPTLQAPHSLSSYHNKRNVWYHVGHIEALHSRNIFVGKQYRKHLVGLDR